MSITAIVQNDTIKLPVHVPDGTTVEIILSPEVKTPPAGSSFFDTIRDLVGSVDGLPEDFAAEHDHSFTARPSAVQSETGVW